jgi:hypothetical protein
MWFRTAIFIDGGYMDKVLLNEFGGTKISYERLTKEVASIVHPNLDILRTYY